MQQVYVVTKICLGFLLVSKKYSVSNKKTTSKQAPINIFHAHRCCCMGDLPACAYENVNNTKFVIP